MFAVAAADFATEGKSDAPPQWTVGSADNPPGEVDENAVELLDLPNGEPIGGSDGFDLAPAEPSG